MPSRRIADLEPKMVVLVGEWLRLCGSKGVPVLVFTTYRSSMEQADLYRIGRDENGKVISGARIVTNAKPGQSLHNHEIEGKPASRAIDAVPWEFVVTRTDSLKFKLDWTPFNSPAEERQFRDGGDLHLLRGGWRTMAEMADRVGLEWAGRWTSFVEYVHFQRPRPKPDASTIA